MISYSHSKKNANITHISKSSRNITHNVKSSTKKCKNIKPNNQFRISTNAQGTNRTRLEVRKGFIPRWSRWKNGVKGARMSKSEHKDGAWVSRLEHGDGTRANRGLLGLGEEQGAENQIRSRTIDLPGDGLAW